jgi:hypothetical protein
MAPGLRHRVIAKAASLFDRLVWREQAASSSIERD